VVIGEIILFLGGFFSRAIFQGEFLLGGFFPGRGGEIFLGKFCSGHERTTTAKNMGILKYHPTSLIT
jgi:hypothetical protein